MMKVYPLMLGALLFMTCATATACVKVRDGSDESSPSGGMGCMQFSSEQRHAAALLGLSLEAPYKAVQAKLASDGWVVDSQWLKEYESDFEVKVAKLPVCGQGYDAVCYIQVKKGDARLEVTFSGTNEGLPLISVSPL